MILSLSIALNITVVAGLATFTMRSQNYVLATIVFMLYRVIFSVTINGFSLDSVILEVAIFGLFGFYVFKTISLDPENVAKATVTCIVGLLVLPIVLLALVTKALVAVLI